MLPESLEELKLTLEANESPLKKWPDNFFGHIVHGNLSREGMEIAFLKDTKEALRHAGKLEDLRNIGTAGKAGWQLHGFASMP